MAGARICLGEAILPEDFEYPSLEDRGSLVMSTGAKQAKRGGNGAFHVMGFRDNLMRAIKRKGYNLPTPIQRKVIPVALEGQDVVAMARTGSGKTAAFLLPMIQKLESHSEKYGARALIVSPTRELALQTYGFCRDLVKYSDLRAVLLVGGEGMEEQFEALRANPDIIIATPGRLLHQLEETKMGLGALEVIVLDEADRLFEMGFKDQILDIFKAAPETRQTMLFSATMPRMLLDFSKAGLRDPAIVRLDTESKLSENLSLSFLLVHSDHRIAVLLHLCRDVITSGQQTIIFCATRHHVEYVHEILSASNLLVSVLYGSMDQTARSNAVVAFRQKRVEFLVVTDVAARGVDIPLLDYVINFDFPPSPKLFVHRAGRVARAGRSGTAYSLVGTEEVPYMLDLKLFLGITLTPGSDGEGSVRYGTVPQRILDAVSEKVNNLHATDDQLDNLLRVAKNAYKLYHKTKAAASVDSAKASKTIDWSVTHPMFLDDSTRAVVEQEEAVARALKSYKPIQTVFEFASSSSAASVIMQKKRKALQLSNSIKRTRMESENQVGDATSESKVAHLPSKPVISAMETPSFKDERFYIGMEKKGDTVNEFEERGYALDQELKSHQSLDSMVLDLVPDTSEDMQKRKNVMKWDAKKKKYIRTQVGKDGKEISTRGKVRNEAGVVINTNGKKKSSYLEWQKRTKKRIPSTGEETEALGAPKQLYGRARFHRNDGATEEKSKSSAKGHVRQELKNPDQIRKDRAKKESIRKRMNFLQHKSGASSNARGGPSSGGRSEGGRGGARGSARGGARGSARGRAR